MLVTMWFESIGRPRRTFSTRLSQRQWFPAELEAAVLDAGFRIIDRLGDFRGGSLENGSDSQVLLLAPRGRRGQR
jgi:hypothetical protein